MTDKFIIESFWQKAANCAGLALIKAAILKYGTRGLFKQERRKNNILLTFKDGKLLVLTDKEIEELNKSNKILFSPYRDATRKKQLKKLKAVVELCFAAMVRKVQLEGYDGKEYTQTTAIRLLTHEGMKTDHLHRLLGLSRKNPSSHALAQKHLALFKRKKGVLLYSDTHIVVVSKGIYEDFGKAVPLNDETPVLKGKKAAYWFELK